MDCATVDNITTLYAIFFIGLWLIQYVAYIAVAHFSIALMAIENIRGYRDHGLHLSVV